MEVGSGDIEKMFRLGRREQGKERPLLVRFTRVEKKHEVMGKLKELKTCLLYTSPSPRDRTRSRMPSSA